MERQLRLREEADVRAARSRGKAYADGPLVARILANECQPPQNRYTVVAGKRAGKAVQRNRLKRVVREALRHLHPTLRPGHDIVVIVRGTVEELPDLATARTVLDRIVKRARLETKPSANQLSAVSRQPSGTSDQPRQPPQSTGVSSNVHQPDRLSDG